MLLKDFIKIISGPKIKNKKDCDIEFWLNDNTELSIKRVGQFGITKTVTIGFKKERKAPFIKPITNPTVLKKLSKTIRKIQKENR